MVSFSQQHLDSKHTNIYVRHYQSFRELKIEPKKSDRTQITEKGFLKLHNAIRVYGIM